MKKHHKKASWSWCASLLMLFCYSSTTNAQQALQNTYSRSFSNPAAMGELQDIEASLYGQYGLVGFEGAPKEASMNATVPFTANRNNYIGTTYAGSEVGVHSRVVALISYGHKVRLGENTYLTLAVAQGVANSSSQYERATNKFVYDYTLSEQSSSSLSYAWQVGGFLQSKNYYAALYSQSTISTTHNLQFGWRSNFESNWNMDISTIGSYLQHAKQYQQEITALAVYNSTLSMGLSYRTQNNVAILAYLSHKNISLGYAYQVYRLNFGLQSHELLLKYAFKSRKKPRS